MNTRTTDSTCPVCGTTILRSENTFCGACDRRILLAIQALANGDSIVIVPTSVN